MTLTSEAPSLRAPAETVRVIRPPHLAERVVCVDGLPGCGKTLLSAIVSALDRVEVEKYNYPLEYICALRYLGRITDDAAVAMVRMLTDLDLYDLSASRETNFRPADLSSAFRHPRAWRYLRRLFQPDGEASMRRIARERPILNLITHNLLPISEPLIEALDDRLVIVEVVRHPLYMLKQWFLYIARYGTDVRDFTIWVEAGERAVPWFAQGWEVRYLSCDQMDRVIYAIDHLGRLRNTILNHVSAAQAGRIVTIPFEQFVLEPWPYLHQLERVMGTTMTSATRRELRRQRVPRRLIADGLELKVYRDNGWQPPQRGATEADELSLRRQFAAAQATPAAMEVLDRLCREYEVAHLSGRSTVR